MKRFFCTICKKVKRVRQWPITMDVDSIQSTDPTLRVGSCNRHFESRVARPMDAAIARMKKVVR